MDKKDFILKNYSRTVLVFSCAWLIIYWSGGKINSDYFINPNEAPWYVNFISTIAPLFLMIAQFIMKSNIYNRLSSIKEGDIVKNKITKEYAMVKDVEQESFTCLTVDFGRDFPMQVTLPKTDWILIERNVYDSRVDKLDDLCKKYNLIKPNRHYRGADSVIIIYHLILKIWHKEKNK